MEVSSHALDQSRVAGAWFDAACVTNVTHDHLDYHANLRDYRLAKGEALRSPRGRGLRGAQRRRSRLGRLSCASSTAPC